MKISLNANFACVISVSALVALAGCGGGGDPAVVPPAIAPTMVSGTAAKGIVKRANVLVCRVVNGVPEPDATCAAGTTGVDGSFAVALKDAFTGPALVKVTASDTSVMLDETSGVDIAYNMVMRSVVPAVSTATITYVTPFSEMAASLALFSSVSNSTALDALVINAATGGVQTLLSNLTAIDLAVKPVIDLKNNGSDPVLLGKQANLVKQLARLTMTAKRAPDTPDSSFGVHCNTPGTSASQQLACATNVMSSAMSRGGNFAAFAFSRIIPTIVAENPTSIAMAIIRADGTLNVQVADMTSAVSMQSAMRNAGMPEASLVATVQIMMMQMR